MAGLKRTFIPLVVWGSLAALALGNAMVAEANMFARSFPKLRYDIISIANSPPSAQAAEVVQPGADIDVGKIEATADIPKDGVSGILFDMGYACQPGMGNTTLPLPDFASLTKIALIRRGDCIFRTKIINASQQGASAALIYNNPDDTALDSATAALIGAKDALPIPAVLMAYHDGILLLENLEQTKQTNGTNQIHQNRVRGMLASQQVIPGVWEFILIVVVVLLGVSFTVSVILHCRLYALRQRVRMDMIARGADVMPNGTLRMRRVTMKKANLDAFPVRTYGCLDGCSSTITGTGDVSPSPLTLDADAIELVSSASSKMAMPNREIREHEDSGPSLVTPEPSAERTRSRSRSIHSVNSICSQKSTEIASALDATPNASIESRGSAPLSIPAVYSDHNTCSICLDDFAHGDELRTLPCHHEFHCECIDPWLTSKSSTCPLCKHDCLPPTEEELEGRGEDRNVVIPNDRFIEFVMGPDWVHARTMHNHHRFTFSDRLGRLFVTTSDRLHGRRQHPQPEHSSVRPVLNNPQQLTDQDSQVPLQLITTTHSTTHHNHMGYQNV